MGYIPITPFGRRVDSTLIENHNTLAQATDLPDRNKWDVLREIVAAREALNLHPRSIDVLQTLLSFYPKTILEGQGADLVVFPSNATICERMHGIACSTMRRHLAALVTAGLIIRRDSPNGKRFIKRSGTAPQPFGFDLRPLLVRFTEFQELAEATRAAETQLQDLRRTVCLMRRDLAALTEYAMKTQPNDRSWDALDDMARLTARTLRRNLSMGDLDAIKDQLSPALKTAMMKLDIHATPEMSTNDIQNEQHSQRSNKEYISKKRNRIEQRPPDDLGLKDAEASIPLTLVRENCPEAENYLGHPINSWDDLHKAASTIFPMMGIPRAQWNAAQLAMGPKVVGVVILVMLERFSELRSPGAYLRHLTKKATRNAFSCVPMLTALSQRTA